MFECISSPASWRVRNGDHGGGIGGIEWGRSGVRRLRCPRTRALLRPSVDRAGSGSSAHAVAPRTPGLQVVASGLNQPHHLTIGPDGDLYVAEAGDGVVGAGCRDGSGGRLCQQLGHHRPHHAAGRGDPRGHGTALGG